MVGRCSRRPGLTSGRGGLMTNWWLSPITVITHPTPVGLLNGSILYVNPPFLSLSIFELPTLSPSRGSNTPPLSLSVWARGRHRGSLIASYFHEAKFITLTAPAHAAYF